MLGELRSHWSVFNSPSEQQNCANEVFNTCTRTAVRLTRTRWAANSLEVAKGAQKQKDQSLFLVGRMQILSSFLCFSLVSKYKCAFTLQIRKKYAENKMFFSIYVS